MSILFNFKILLLLIPSRFPLTLKSTTIWEASGGYNWKIQKQLEACVCLFRYAFIYVHLAVQISQAWGPGYTVNPR